MFKSPVGEIVGVVGRVCWSTGAVVVVAGGVGFGGLNVSVGADAEGLLVGGFVLLEISIGTPVKSESSPSRPSPSSMLGTFVGEGSSTGKVVGGDVVVVVPGGDGDHTGAREEEALVLPPSPDDDDDDDADGFPPFLVLLPLVKTKATVMPTIKALTIGPTIAAIR